jgi:hypothetical protein
VGPALSKVLTRWRRITTRDAAATFIAVAAVRIGADRNAGKVRRRIRGTARNVRTVWT